MFWAQVFEDSWNPLEMMLKTIDSITLLTNKIQAIQGAECWVEKEAIKLLREKKMITSDPTELEQHSEIDLT